MAKTLTLKNLPDALHARLAGAVPQRVAQRAHRIPPEGSSAAA